MSNPQDPNLPPPDGAIPPPDAAEEDVQPVVPVPLSAPVPVQDAAADLGYPSSPSEAVPVAASPVEDDDGEEVVAAAVAVDEPAIPAPSAAAVPPPSVGAPPPPTDAVPPAPSAADSLEHEAVAPVAPVHLPGAAETSKTKEKAAALSMAILVHVALAALLTVFVIVVPGPPASEITAIAAPTVQEQTPTTKKIAEPPPQQQVTQMAASMKFMTATNASSVPMPAVEFDPQATSLDLGTTMGDFSTSFGGGGGGAISFMGNTSTGRRVVFAVDASASMNSKGKGANKGKISKFDLMKEELDESIRKLPQGTEYQIIFFSAFGWPHDEVDTRSEAEWEAYRWRLNLNNPDFKDAIPKYKYLSSTPENMKKSRKIIQETEMTLGTQWGPPVLMALNIRPKPDIVFFMTDGTTGNPKAQIEAINEMNKRGGKRATIHTTAMMEPDAAQDLSDLATANGGEFTIITADRKTIKGEDFFKN